MGIPLSRHEPPKSPAATPDRILTAAKRLFASNGYGRTTTSAIARAAGTSESQLIKYFTGKEGVLATIFENGWLKLTEEVRQQLNVANGPTEKAKTLLRTVLLALESDPDFERLILLEGRRIRTDVASSMITAGFLQFIEVVDSVFEEMQDLHLLKPAVPLHAMRSGLMGLVEGLLRDRHLAVSVGYPAQYTLPDVIDSFELALAAFMVPAELPPVNPLGNSRF